MTEVDVPELDDTAARALCSIVLEHTATALLVVDDGPATALLALEKDSGLPLDVCAGILFATSWLAGAGELDAEEVFTASLSMKPDDTDAG